MFGIAQFLSATTRSSDCDDPYFGCKFDEAFEPPAWLVVLILFLLIGAIAIVAALIKFGAEWSGRRPPTPEKSATRFDRRTAPPGSDDHDVRERLDQVDEPGRIR